MTGFNRGFCNAYGSENRDGQAVLVGGLLKGENRVATQWICKNRAEVRARWHCANGHKSAEPVELCRQHWLEFTGSKLVAANLRRDVHTCPLCASLAPSREEQPKVKCWLEAVS